MSTVAERVGEWQCPICGKSPEDGRCTAHPKVGRCCVACYDKLPPPPREWLREVAIQDAIEEAEAWFDIEHPE